MKGSLRIVAGTLRGRTIRCPDDSAVRPTSERVREALFSSLYSLGALENAEVLELYAGSGVFSFEAISRGACSAELVERSSAICRAIQTNAENLGLSSQITLHSREVDEYLADPPNKAFSLVFADPPYQDRAASRVLEALARSFSRLAEGAIIVLETERSEKPRIDDSRFELLRRKVYGNTALHYFRFVSSTSEVA